MGAEIATIESIAFPNVYLRMDGIAVDANSDFGQGTVNCQFGPPQGYEQFHLDQQGDGTVALRSVPFSNVYLRMDGTGVDAFAPTGGGTVNCQLTPVGLYERFLLEPQADGTIAIASVQFPQVYLRLDSTGVSAFAPSGAGTVNCQYAPAGPYEKFRIAYMPEQLDTNQ